MKSHLGYKMSFIGLGNYQPKTGPKLLFSTIPIYAKIHVHPEEELWIIQSDDDISGEICFCGKNITFSGNLGIGSRIEDDCTVLSFKQQSGYAKISIENEAPLHIICLTGEDLLTFIPIFKSNYWDNEANECEPIAIFWGCYNVYYNVSSLEFLFQQCNPSTTIFCVSKLHNNIFNQTKGIFQEPVEADWDYLSDNVTAVGTVRELQSDFNDINLDPIELKHYSQRVIDFEKLEWIALPVETHVYNYFFQAGEIPLLNPIDLGYVSGHSIYKIDFILKCKS